MYVLRVWGPGGVSSLVLPTALSCLPAHTVRCGKKGFRRAFEEIPPFRTSGPGVVWGGGTAKPVRQSDRSSRNSADRAEE